MCAADSHQLESYSHRGMQESMKGTVYVSRGSGGILKIFLTCVTREVLVQSEALMQGYS